MKDNIISLHAWCDKKNDLIQFYKYVKKIADEENIYKVLLDTIDISSALGASCYYHINNNKIKIFFDAGIDEQTINFSLSNKKPNNKSESLLKSIYENRNKSHINPIETSEEMLFFEETKL